MTLEIGFLLIVIAAMVYLFLTEKLAIDLTAFLGLVVLVLTGYLGPKEAFSGFASAAVHQSVVSLGSAVMTLGPFRTVASAVVIILHCCRQATEMRSGSRQAVEMRCGNAQGARLCL